MTTSQPLPIGIVGLGTFGWQHASTLAGLAEANLVALVDLDPLRLERAGRTWANARTWNDLDVAIAESEAEAWIVASSTSSHVAIARQLLSAGKTVLLEKPIAESLSGAESLADLVQKDSRNLMMGHILLFNSEFRQLQREVASRGPIQFIDCVRHRPASTMDDFPGESPLKLTMVHDLYSILALKNRQEPCRLTAQLHHSPHGHSGLGQPDLVLAQMQWDDGSIASLTASFLSPQGMAGQGYDRMEVFGQDWAARLRPNPRPIEVWDDRARWPLELEIQTGDPVSGMLAEQLRCFCRVAVGLESVPVGATYQDAVQVQRWMQRLHEALPSRSNPCQKPTL